MYLSVMSVFNQPGVLQDMNSFIDARLRDLKMLGDINRTNCLIFI